MRAGTGTSALSNGTIPNGRCGGGKGSKLPAACPGAWQWWLGFGVLARAPSVPWSQASSGGLLAGQGMHRTNRMAGRGSGQGAAQERDRLTSRPPALCPARPSLYLSLAAGVLRGQRVQLLHAPLQVARHRHAQRLGQGGGGPLPCRHVGKRRSVLTQLGAGGDAGDACGVAVVESL